jgi:hypothetical protein
MSSILLGRVLWAKNIRARTGFVGYWLGGKERDSLLGSVEEVPRDLLTTRFFLKGTFCVRVLGILWVLLLGLNCVHHAVFK